MNTFLIPLANTPQAFAIDLDGTTWNLVSKWNDAPESGWVLDWYNLTNDPVCMNVPLVTGADLAAQYPHLKLPTSLIVFTDGDELAVPTLGNLGFESNIYLVQP